MDETDEADEASRRRIAEYNASVRAETALPKPPGETTPPQQPAQQLMMSTVFIGLGGIGVLIGSLLPWAQVQTVFGTISVAGTTGDGVFTLIAGIALLIIAGVQQWGRGYKPWLLVAAAIVGAVAAGIGVLDLVNVSNKASEVSSAFARASAGVGLYVVIAGGVLAVVGALTGRK